MQAILIVSIVLLYSLQTLFCTFFNRKYKGKEELSSLVFCALEGAFIVVFTLVWMAFGIGATEDGVFANWAGFHFSPSLFTVVIGTLNAVALFGYNISIIKASDKGSYAFMNVAMLFGGIVIPAIYEMFTGHMLELHHYIAIAVMLLSFVFMNYKDMKLKGTPFVYYIYCIVLFVCNGFYGVFMKLQSGYAEAESNEMIIITYGLMGVIALVQLIFKEKKQTATAFKIGKQAVIPLVLCLLIAATAINVYMILIPLLGNVVTILYTIDNGGVLVLSAVYSVIFFKEKIDALKLFGIVLAVLSIVALALNGDSIAALNSLM